MPGRIRHLITPPVLTATGLDFLLNGVNNSDCRFVWSGANLLPRTSHTAIWKIRHVQQTGYYAEAWHAWNDGSWHGSNYEFGTHPHPCDGTFTASTGQRLVGTGSSGTVHYHEIAGLDAHDYIATPFAPSALLVVKGTWLSKARTCEIIGGTTLRHTHWPDIEGNPSFSIVQDIPLANLESPPNPAFYWGSSDWRLLTAGRTDESPGGVMRHLLQYDRALSLAEIQAKLALTADDTSDPDVWYSCLNPTPDDVTDKSGAGHDPVWANARRPLLWEES